MSNIQALSRQRHASLRWKRYSSYAFAANDAVAALTMHELPKAMLSMPIALFASEGAYLPVAVQSFYSGKNLFVAPDGRWVGGYVPAVYRSSPFLLADSGDGKQVLCMDEDSGLLTDAAGADTEPFFGEDGQPGKAVAEVLDFLNQNAASRKATQSMCAVLQKHHLIQPWPIKVQAEEGEQKIEGLFRVDETALNQLSADAFMEVRNSGALPLVYCQLLSMQHLPLLAQLVQAHAKAAAAAAPALPVKGKDLDLSFMEGNGTFQFGGLL